MSRSSSLDAKYNVFSFQNRLHPEACVIELHTFGFQKYGYESLMHYLRQCYMAWVNGNENATVATWKSMQSEVQQKDKPCYTLCVPQYIWCIV